MVRQLLEIGVSDFVILEQDAGDDSQDLVQEVDFGDGVVGIAGMFHQESDESDESVQRVETFGSDDSGRVVVLLREGSVAKIDAHLGAKTEKAGDEVVGL